MKKTAQTQQTSENQQSLENSQNLKETSENSHQTAKNPKFSQINSQTKALQKPDIQALSNFIIDFVSKMVSIGTYSSRVSRCAERIAQSFGYELSLNFSFNHTLINIVDPQNYAISRTYIVKNKYSVVNYQLISALSALSWAIYDHIHDINVAKRAFARLLRLKAHSAQSVIILQAIANASFSRLFGGDLGTIFLVFLAGLVGAGLRVILSRLKLDIRLIYIICAFLSSYIAVIGAHFELTQTPAEAIASSILYLTPGVFFINSVIDILKNYIQMGLSRATSVIILISCVAIGLYITLTISDFRLLQ